MLKKLLKNLGVMGFAATLTLAPAAMAMTGTQYGRVVIGSGDIAPAKGDLTFIAFINGTDDVIHTENAYNSPLGLGQGYITRENTGYYLVNFANFSESKKGDDFTVLFTNRSDNRQGKLTGTVPASLTTTNDVVTLADSVAPLVPQNVRAQRTENGVVVSWNAEPNTAYRVYRADLPSGAENGASRGIYEKVAEGVTGGTFTDVNTKLENAHWYIIVAENKNGVWSGHSDEVRVLPVGGQLTNEGISTMDRKAIGDALQPANNLENSGHTKIEGKIENSK